MDVNPSKNGQSRITQEIFEMNVWYGLNLFLTKNFFLTIHFSKICIWSL